MLYNANALQKKYLPLLGKTKAIIRGLDLLDRFPCSSITLVGRVRAWG